MERKEFQLVCTLISGSFRENADRNSAFYFFNGGENGFHALFDVFSVQEKTVKITHPGGEQRDGFHFFFGNIPCQVRTQNIGEKNIKKTSVISYVKYSLVFWHVFVTDNGDICACNF